MSRRTQADVSRAPKAAPLPRFSPARIKLYLFCPRAYFFYYTRGLKWGGMTAGHAFGGNLHRVLQRFHAQGGAAQVPVESLLEQLRDRWSSAGFATEEEEAAHLALGEALLRQHHAAAPEPGRTTLWTERTVQHRYPDFVLFGKIDRLDRRADGSLEVVDYKSGRLSISEERVRGDLALSIYELLVARENPGVPVHAGIHCLRSACCATLLRTPEELEGVERDVTEIVHAIMCDEEMAARPGEQCRECVYPRVCSPGRRWLRERHGPG